MEAITAGLSFLFSYSSAALVHAALADQKHLAAATTVDAAAKKLTATMGGREYSAALLCIFSNLLTK